MSGQGSEIHSGARDAREEVRRRKRESVMDDDTIVDVTVKKLVESMVEKLVVCSKYCVGLLYFAGCMPLH